MAPFTSHIIHIICILCYAASYIEAWWRDYGLSIDGRSIGIRASVLAMVSRVSDEWLVAWPHTVNHSLCCDVTILAASCQAACHAQLAILSKPDLLKSNAGMMEPCQADAGFCLFKAPLQWIFIRQISPIAEN